MGEIEYLVAEIRHTYGNYSYYAAGYGRFSSEASLLDRLGLDGWELVSSSGSQMRFKRVEEDNNYSRNNFQYENTTYYSAELERIISVISTGFVAIGKEMQELKTREIILTGLLQALVEKFCPDSEFLQSLKAEMGLADTPLAKADSPEVSVESVAETNNGNDVSIPSGISDVKAEKIEATSSNLSNEAQLSGENGPTENGLDINNPIIPEQIVELATECVESALRNYKEEDCTMGFMAMLVANISLMEPCAMRCQEMIAALYRFYYKNNQDEKIKDCYANTLQGMALYFSCYESISLLQQGAPHLTPGYGATVFFELLLAELKNNQEAKSPFSIDTIPEMINTYVTQLKQDSELSKDDKLIAEVKEFVIKIQKQYNIECDNV